MASVYFTHVCEKAQSIGMEVLVDTGARKLKYTLARRGKVIHRAHTVADIDGWLTTWMTYVR